MKSMLKPVAALVLMITIQIFVYSTFIEPYTLSWGASKEEVKMALAGDSLAPYISSTRAITINAPAMTVWHWIIQLGADRSGFFSYTFIEKALGYEERVPVKSFPEFTEMEKGRVIPGTMDASNTKVNYSWPVLLVEPGKAFVLENWGAFAVKAIDENMTRLIVRTHGRKNSTILENMRYFFIVPLHFIMERRMLMGFKACAETGQHHSSAADGFWFAEIVLSFAGIVLMAFWARGMSRYFLCSGLGVLWLMTLLTFKPSPLYSLPILVIVIILNIVLLQKIRQLRLYGSGKINGYRRRHI